MKLNIFIALVFSIQASASVYSQTAKLSLEMKKTSLEEVIDVIRDQSDFRFLYNHEEIAIVKDVSVDFNKATLEEILDKVLSGYDLDYKIVNKVVVITPAPGKTIRNQVKPAEEEQDKVTIRGTVNDENGNPIPGASVFIKGTTYGNATDLKGEFSFDVPAGEYTFLVASFIGYITQEIEINNNTEFRFVLNTDVTGLAEVVVTGYQTLSKERATGSFAKLNDELLNKASSSISERLMGTLAGVNTNIRDDGSISFEIRGMSSLFGDANPLVVVDGFPVVQEEIKNDWGQTIFRADPFATINPNDVESITVLKDASAASIWGAKSANGVIVITTKKGKKGKPKIEYSSFMKVSQLTDLDYLDPRATAEETLEYEKKMYDLTLVTMPWNLPTHTPISVGSAQSQAITLWNENRLGNISEADMNAGIAALSGLDNRNQQARHFLQNQFTQQHNFSISGGTDNMSNGLSMMYENGKGAFVGDDHNKAVVSFNNGTEITDWLNFEFGGTLQWSSQSNNSSTEFTGMQPYDMIENEDGTLADMNYLKFYLPILETMVPTENFPVSDWSYNPAKEINQYDFRTEELNTRIRTGLNIKILEGLSFNTKIIYERLSRTNTNHYFPDSYTMRSMINQTSAWDIPTGVVTPIMPSGGGLSENSTTIDYYNFRNQLNFNRTFNDRHAINFIAGTEISNRVYQSSYEQDIFGYYNDERLSVGRLLTTFDPNASMWTGMPLMYARYFFPIDIDDLREFDYRTSRTYSMYGNLAYTFDEKYSVSVSARTDASNLITADPKFRYNPFWSAGASWQLGKEEFLSDLSWLDRLTVRGTVGYLGNFDPTTSPYALLDIAGTANYYSGETTASISNFGNPNLRWERTRNLNLGVDFAILNSKLFGSLELYHKQGNDLIVEQSIPSINGTKLQKFNNGEMVNKGIELSLNTSIPIVGNDIRWYGGINFAYNHNEVTSFFKTVYQTYDLQDGGTSAYSEGYDANTLWAFEYAGMHNFGTEADPLMAPAIQGVGDDVYGITTWAPGTDARQFMVPEGTRVAPYLINLYNSFRIYDFDLSFIISGKFGHKYNAHCFDYNPLWGGNTSVNDMYSVVANGDPDEIVPIPEDEFRYYFYGRYIYNMSYNVLSASHIRFQEVSLTYNLPRETARKIGVEGIQAYVQGNNLGVIVWNGLGEDPEYPIGGLKPQATVTIGLKVNL